MHHFKLNMKAAIEGTIWQWHQDYMSWQMDGIARPDMTTMMVMMEDATEIGGCLYFLPGSHKMGRIDPGEEGRGKLDRKPGVIAELGLDFRAKRGVAVQPRHLIFILVGHELEQVPGHRLG